MKEQAIKPDHGETKVRIMQHLATTNDPIKLREIALTWSGYLGALTEWFLISIQEHAECHELIRPWLTDEDPTKIIFLGIPDEDLERLGFDAKQE